MSSSLTKRVQRIRHAIAEQVEQDLEKADRGRKSLAIYVVAIAKLIWRQWVLDKCPQAAASLAYETALSLVPLTAVCFALLKAVGGLSERSDLVIFISEQVLPISKDQLATKLTAAADKIGVNILGATGVVSMMAAAYILFHTVERIYNDIWRVERRRSLANKLVVFYTLTTIIPFLLGVSLSHTFRLWHSPVLGAIIAYCATVAGLTLQNKLLPHCQVNWRPALLGGVVSGTVLETAKVIFRVYARDIAFSNYSGVYGPLGLVALLFIWIYLGWLIVLFGAEITYAAQHLRRRRGLTFDEIASFVGRPVGARVALTLARAEKNGAPPSTAQGIADHLLAPRQAIDDVLLMLERADLVRENGGGFVLSRPASRITFADVTAAFRGSDLKLEADPVLDGLLDRIDDSERQLGGDVTLEDLVFGRASTSPRPERTSDARPEQRPDADKTAEKTERPPDLRLDGGAGRLR
jgi:membrane protein